MANRICVQIQPDLAPELDITKLRQLCEELASGKAEFSVGAEREDIVNFLFDSDDPNVLWKLMEQRLYLDETIGAALSKASIVVCDGPNEWDDYRLLRHFDPARRLDGFQDE